MDTGTAVTLVLRVPVQRQRRPVVLQAVLKLRSCQVSTAIPSLSTDGARSRSRDILAAFPAPALPGFISSDGLPDVNGTMRPSDSLKAFAVLAD